MQDAVDEATNFVADAARLKAIKDLLGKSPTGAAALELVEVMKIQVVFSANTGDESYWDASNRRIVIARQLDSVEAALTLVHEAQHAGARWLAGEPDPRTLSRDEYVRKNLEDEVQSRVAEMRTADELMSAASRGEIPGFVHVQGEMETAYRTAHGIAYSAASGSLLDHESAEAAGRSAGEEAMMKLLRTTTFDSGGDNMTDGETYADYWDRAWQDAQPKPSPVDRNPPNLTGVM